LEWSQADFSNKTSVGAYYGIGSEVSVAFVKPMEFFREHLVLG